MKTRSLLILLVLALILTGLAAWVALRPPPGPPAEVGRRVLGTLDINDVARIELTSGTQQVALARGADGWTVTALWNYPARFEQIVDLLRDVDGLRMAEIIRGGAEVLAECGLDEQSTDAPVRVALYTTNDSPAAEFLLGHPRLSPAMKSGFSRPDSRYLRAARGPIALAEPFMDDPPRRPADWIKREVLDIPAAAIRSLTAASTKANAYGLKRGDDGTYSGIDALEGKPINAVGADQWFRALQGFTILGVMDPALSHEELGRTTAEAVTATLTNGLVVRVELGNALVPDQDRAAWFAFDLDEADAADAEEADARAARDAVLAERERLQKNVAPWTYRLSAAMVNKLIFARDQLINAEPSGADSPAEMPDKPVD